MYNLKLTSLVWFLQISWRASTRSMWMLPIFNISLIGRDDARRRAWLIVRLIAETDARSVGDNHPSCKSLLRWIKPNNRLWVEYNKNKLFNNIMTECINIYLATQPIARSLLSCGVRLFVTLMYRNGQFLLSNFFIAWWPHHSSFPSKGKIYLNSEFILTVKFRRGHPQQGRQRWLYQKFTIFNPCSISEIPIPIPNTEVFQNTDTEYRTDMKKIPTKIPNTDTDSKYRYRPSSTQDPVSLTRNQSHR